MPQKLLSLFTGLALLVPTTLGLCLRPEAGVAVSSGDLPAGCELVVLAEAGDPYSPLAEEIAAAENALLVQNLEEALACRPAFLLWVAAPGSLSEARLIEFGLAMKQQPEAISTGLITASTLEGARALWERRTQVRGQSLFIVNAANPAAHIEEGRIMALQGEQASVQPLTKSNLTRALEAADYLTFTGHGASRYLRLDEATTLAAGDVPALEAAVITTGSCQTLQPWKEDSIALGFVDQGAAIYSGFVFSPNEGYLMGQFDGLPFRHTWPDFPIGHALQVQNRGTVQGFAHFPYQYLLGDPRAALQPRPPYQLVEDREEGSWRILSYQDVPAGIVPIRIAGGAAYSFVQVKGITATAEGDPFYNSRLQMADIREDKYILLAQGGGELTLRLRRQAPWYWFPTDILLDSLDDVLLFSPQAGGDIIALGFLSIPLAWCGWQALRKHIPWRMLRSALAIGAGAAFLQGVYTLLRLNQVTIISKAVVFSPTGLAAGFLLTACGALIYFRARRLGGKVLGLLVMTFVSWSPMVFSLAAVGIFNIVFFIPAMGTALYNYSAGLLPAGAFALTLGLARLAVGVAERMEENSGY